MPKLGQGLIEGDIELGETCLKQKYFNWKAIDQLAPWILKLKKWLHLTSAAFVG